MKKFVLRSGSQRHRHFVGFFNGPNVFTVILRNRPHFSHLLQHAWGYGGHILDFTIGSPWGQLKVQVKL